MKSVAPEAVRDVLLLSIAAGSADAAGFFGLGRVFTSNMTGNLVLLGVAVGQGHVVDAARSILVLAVFTLGVGVGIRLALPVRDGNWAGLAGRLVNLEKILLLAFAIGWLVLHPGGEFASDVLLAALAFAMGLQTAALSRLGAPGVGTTAITSTITALVTGLVVHVAAPEQSTSRQRLAFQAGVLALYGAGAAVGGMLILRLPWLAGFVPLAATAFAIPTRTLVND